MSPPINPRFRSNLHLAGAVLVLAVFIVGCVLLAAGVIVFWVAMWRRDIEMLWRVVFCLSLGLVAIVAAYLALSRYYPEDD